MDSAANAVNRLFSSKETVRPDKSTTNTSVDASATTTAGVEDTTVDSNIKPAVEHTHVTKEHETREQTFIEKEKHQDHYHTTIQPLKDSEVRPEKHDHVQETETREFNNDDGAAKAKAEADRAGFENTKDVKKVEVATKEPTLAEEHVHHHLHETIQPVIEKEVLDPSVTHKRIDIKEKHQEAAVNHGVTTNSAISVDEFKNKLDGESSSTAVDGKAL